MRGRFLSLVLACAAVVLGGPAGAGPIPGLVRIASDPPGLDAWCDTTFVGRTPVEARCAPGPVRVHVREPSDSLFLPAALDTILQVSEAETVSIRVSVTPLVTVRSRPYGLPVLRDGERVGETPLQLRLRGRGQREDLDLLTWNGPVPVPVDTLVRDGSWTWRGALPREPRLHKEALPAWRRTGRTLLPVLALALGLGGAYMENEADRSYERYERATDPRAIDRYYDRTVRQDRTSTALWVAAEVSLVVSIVAWILPDGDVPLVPEGMP